MMIAIQQAPEWLLLSSASRLRLPVVAGHRLT
jgi:hypothetical protein